jgi:aryl-alcohol dehydrogenase-like predicted oxidoreductase
MVSSAIIGARSVAQARDNLAAGGWTLPAEIRSRLDAVSAPAEHYPVNIEHFFRKRRADAIRK